MYFLLSHLNFKSKIFGKPKDTVYGIENHFEMYWMWHYWSRQLFHQTSHMGCIPKLQTQSNFNLASKCSLWTLWEFIFCFYWNTCYVQFETQDDKSVHILSLRVYLGYPVYLKWFPFIFCQFRLYYLKCILFHGALLENSDSKIFLFLLKFESKKQILNISLIMLFHVPYKL